MHEQLTLDLWPEGDPNPVECCSEVQELFPHLKYKYTIHGMTAYSSSPQHAMDTRDQLESILN